ncbi:MAG: TonB family protein [Hymenobacter sp.]|nr:MAG: TonB family protein [Hymenobacter sp.]
MRYVYIGIGMLGLLPQLACGQAAADTLAPASPPQAAAEAARRVSSRVDSAGACTELLRWGDAGGLLRVFYPSGRLKEYVPYMDVAAGYIHGLATTWYESGQLRTSEAYWQGSRDGALVLYYENGQLKRQTQYAAGSELPGSCFDAAGAEVPYFPYEQLPLYPGGHAQLAKEVNKALRWPREVPLLLSAAARSVCISFWVGKDGRIENPQVAVSSQLPSLDQAVLAAIAKLARRFTPARRDGVVVPSRYYLPVEFSGVAASHIPQKI